MTTSDATPEGVASSEGLGRTLLPCPFCGGPVLLERAYVQRHPIHGERQFWSVICRNTNNRGGSYCMEQVPSASQEAAVARWNMRNGVADSERHFPFAFEVWQGDERQASASGPRDTALREAMRYAAQYAGDGQVRVFEVTRVLVSP